MTPQEQIEIGQLSNTEIAKSLQLLIDAYKYSGFESAVLNEAIRRLNPWTTITADPATLPQHMAWVIVALHDAAGDFALPATRGDIPGQFISASGHQIEPDSFNCYAWREMPAPPPYPGAAETQKATP
jgi:hypothetical protein